MWRARFHDRTCSILLPSLRDEIAFQVQSMARGPERESREEEVDAPERKRRRARAAGDGCQGLGAARDATMLVGLAPRAGGRQATSAGVFFNNGDDDAV